ncbi:chloride intracellular channel Clic isoform X1 [Helicoverpa armigera]|uniref:CLIC N-terminal domain-containing protein n=1 Tax=Heliothis virescens TaxID=7102 RepID=A0A2A4K014_HELVI|nr:chloride intracellular channel exc-4 isoform X1 [Helicoverpa armigera]XP_047032203.1 chloride intracellular channel exc-4 isoform X1 [Helicoverpa zea]
MSDEIAENGTANGDVPEIELIIKASTIDGRRKGACLFCQEYFMDLYLLAELKTISLKVTTVDMQKPPPDFRTNFEATHPPILIDNGLAILENEKIERHIMKSVPGGHNLFVQDKEVASLIENLYSKLKLVLVRKDEQKSAALRAHLGRIDGLLERRGTRFLTGDTMCCFDCELMPRLQHIRVAGKYFVDFEIPTSFRALWRYMYHMYQLDAFTQSCPADQDIINHYKLQQLSTKGLVLSPTPTLQRKEIPTDVALKMKKHEELETPTFTTSIPIDVSENSNAE